MTASLYSSKIMCKNVQIDTGHEDMIHDAQMDFLGSRMATCSCDKTIRIFDVNFEQPTMHQLAAELKGHEGPVWQVAWASPRYGSILASCSYDRRVIIWKELNGKWEIHFNYDGHDSSVNSVCWAPAEWGLTLACGSSDSTITVLHWNNERWIATKIPSAHPLGCNAVSWAPSSLRSKQSKGQTIKRFVSGGCDNLVKIWKEENDHWIEECKLEGHSDWVRDVAWAATTGLSGMKIASSSQDRRVIIWINREDDFNWIPEPLHVFDDVVWHVSWNFLGDVLACSGGDNQVSLWKKKETGGWICITSDSNSNKNSRSE